MNPDSAVEEKSLTEEQTFRSEKQWVSTSEEATAVTAVRNDVKQIEAASQASKKTLN